jgi:uncharacterized membrane protein
LEQLVSFLFKYSSALLSKGQFGFTSKPSLWLFLLLAALLGLLIYFVYSGRAAQVGSGWRAGLIALRCALVAVIVFCVMRPVVVIPSVVPQSSYVLVLVDDSASMALPADAEQTRLEQAKQLIAAGGTFLGPLAEKFKVREYKFSQLAERIEDAGQLSAAGQQTDLGAALEQSARETAGLPTSGIILITDGADNRAVETTAGDRGESDQSKLGTTLAALRNQGVPVYAIGLGEPVLTGDVELVRASAPRRVLTGSPVTAEVLVRYNGDKKTIRIDLSEDNHTLRSQDVPVQPNAASVARITFTPSSPGLHRYRFVSPPADDDPAPANNTQELLLEVSDSKPRILYFEGEPRWEYGKLREAVTEEKNFTLVSVLRSADGKYYRQSIERPEELADGFPKAEDALFKFDSLLLGSIEATFFTFDQLKAIEQFVSRRGGTLLAIGGKKSFNSGGYSNTPLADLLPVYLNGTVNASADIQAFKAAPADRGKDHPAARLKDEADENARAWEKMPAITLPDVINEIKPGATIILEARGAKDKNRVAPLLVEERYGRGRTMALMSSDTWRWRMMLDSKDQSFETFWRNLFRYSLEGVRQPVEVTTERGFYAGGERVRIKAEVADEKYQPVRDATVTARVLSPTGEVSEVILNRGLSGEVEVYAGEFVPAADGVYRIDVAARRGGRTEVKAGGETQSKPAGEIGSARINFLVGDLNREARNAGQNIELLKRIAAETRGGYYTTDQASRLLEDITHKDGPGSIREAKELWDMPINFLLIVGLAAGEWFIRKRKGLA